MNAIQRINTTDAAREYLAEDAAALLRMALMLQGPAALVSTCETVARHEAGHAIQYTAEGKRVLSIKIYRRGRDWLGTTNTGQRWRVGQDTDAQVDLAIARTLLAGPLAEWFTSARSTLGSGVDEVALARGVILIASRKLSADAQDLLAVAMRTVLETIIHNQPAFETLTAALIRRNKVKGFPLLRLLQGVEPHNRDHKA